MSTDSNKNKKLNRNKLPVSLRKDKSEYIHTNHKKSPTFFTDPRINEWQHWFLVKNDFPYDMAFSTHHLLFPKREVAEPELNNQEKQELEEIIEELAANYDVRIINYPSKQSVRQHFHIHLLKYKEDRKDLVF